MTIYNLEYMFKSRSIAVIGQGTRDESPDAVLEMNLIEAGFKGLVMPVNPDRCAVPGVLTYKDVASLPEVPDLAIITRPLEECPARWRAGAEESSAGADRQPALAKTTAGSRYGAGTGHAGCRQTLSVAHPGTG